MGFATVFSRSSIGIEAATVTIEVHLANGIPSFSLVGLAETTVREAKERVRSAILQSGFEFPAKRIVIHWIITGNYAFENNLLFCDNIF